MIHHRSGIPHEEAERAFGGTLDRRGRYRVTPVGVFKLYSAEDACSWCSPSFQELGYVPAAGPGCAECGHKGTIRVRFWISIDRSGNYDWRDLIMA